MTTLPTDPYNLETYFIKPTDERGHGEKINARIPPDLGRVIEIIASSTKTPYQTSSDFFRDAVWRLAGLWSAEIDTYEPTSIMGRLAMMEEELKPIVAGQKLLEQIDNLVYRLQSIDTVERKKHLVQRMKEIIGSVKDDYWRNRALTLLNQRFGEYLTDDN